MGVLGCSGWGVLSADRTPPILPGRFCSFVSRFTFTFSQKPLPATCKLCHPQPPSRLPPTPFLSSPWFPFRMANVSVGFLDPHPPDPVPGGCWPHTDLCPPHQNCCRWDPATTSAPQFGPGGHLGVSPSQAVQLRLPHLTLLWGQSDAVLGMVCHHPRGQRATTPGTAWPHTRDGVTCPWGWRDTPTLHSPTCSWGVQGGAAFGGGLGTSPGTRMTRGAGDANRHLDLLLPLTQGQHSCPRQPPWRLPDPGPLLQWPLVASPRVPPQPWRVQGDATVPGPPVPGVPGLVLGARGCPAARLWCCPPGSVRGGGPAGRLKVLARTGKGEASRLICQMIIIAF